jgi:hypothetical protein
LELLISSLSGERMKRNSTQLEEPEASPENSNGQDPLSHNVVDLTGIEDDEEQRTAAAPNSMSTLHPNWLTQSVKDIEAWVQKHAPCFRWPIIGPIGNHVRPKSSLAAAILEHVVDSSDWQHFITQNKFDSDLIEKQVEEFKIPKPKLIRYHDKHLPDRLLTEDTMKELKDQFGVDGFLQDMLTCQPAVWSCLCGLKPQLQMVVLGKPLDSYQLVAEFNRRILLTGLRETSLTLATQSNQGEIKMMRFPFHPDTHQEWCSIAPGSFLRVAPVNGSDAGISCNHAAKKLRTSAVLAPENPSPSRSKLSVVPKSYKHFPELEKIDLFIAKNPSLFENPQIFSVIFLVKPPNFFLASVLENIVPRSMWKTYIVASERDLALLNSRFPGAAFLDSGDSSTPLFSTAQMQVLKRNYGILGYLYEEASLCSSVKRYFLKKIPEMGKILIGAAPTSDNLDALVDFLSREGIASVYIASYDDGVMKFWKINVDYYVQHNRLLASWKISKTTFLWGEDGESIVTETSNRDLAHTTSPMEEKASNTGTDNTTVETDAIIRDSMASCNISNDAEEDGLEMQDDSAVTDDDPPIATQSDSEDDDDVHSPCTSSVHPRDDEEVDVLPSKRQRRVLDDASRPMTSIAVLTPNTDGDISSNEVEESTIEGPDKTLIAKDDDPVESVNHEVHTVSFLTSNQVELSEEEGFVQDDTAGQVDGDDRSIADSNQMKDAPDVTEDSTLIDSNESTLELNKINIDEKNSYSRETFENMQYRAIFLRFALILSVVVLAGIACWFVTTMWQQFIQNVKQEATGRVLTFLTVESELVAGVVTDIGTILDESDNLTAQIKNMRHQINELGKERLTTLAPFHLFFERLEQWEDILKHFHRAVSVYVARFYLERLSVFTNDGQLSDPTMDSQSTPLINDAIAQIMEWKEQQTEIAVELNVLDAKFRRIKLEALASATTESD